MRKVLALGLVFGLMAAAGRRRRPIEPRPWRWLRKPSRPTAASKG